MSDNTPASSDGRAKTQGRPGWVILSAVLALVLSLNLVLSGGPAGRRQCSARQRLSDRDPIAVDRRLDIDDRHDGRGRTSPKRPIRPW